MQARMLERVLVKGRPLFPQGFSKAAIPPQKMQGNRRWKRGKRYDRVD